MVKIMGSGAGLLDSNSTSVSYEVCMLFLLLFYEVTKSEQGNGIFTLESFVKYYQDTLLQRSAVLKV